MAGGDPVTAEEWEKGSRERRRGNIQNRADETERREAENKRPRRRKSFGEGRERKEEQTPEPLIQVSTAAAEPLEGRWMHRGTCEDPNPGLVAQQMPFLS